jgi:hypothetical protein
MTHHKTAKLTHNREPSASDGDPFETSESSLREQAAAYASIAREAREDCHSGRDAELELQQRRNRSGQ